jgi:hypothetical protein
VIALGDTIQDTVLTMQPNLYAFSPDHSAVVVIYFKALRGLPYLQMPWFGSAAVDDSVDLRTESTVPDGRTVQAVWSRGSYQVDAFAAAAGEGGIHGVNSHQNVVNGAPYQVRLYGGREGTRAVYTLFVSVIP